jgi:hypothetical protein
MVSVAALLVWVALADSAVAVRPSAIGLVPDRHVIIVSLGAAAGEAPFARPSLKGALRGALRGALLARFAGRRSRARGQCPAARTATTPPAGRDTRTWRHSTHAVPTTEGGATCDAFHLFRNDVLDGGGAKLGIHEGRCSYLRATRGVIGSRPICDGVYTLQDGTITSSDVLTFSKKPTVAFVVTGGSGAYEGARGSGTLTYRAVTNPFADTTIHLLP